MLPRSILICALGGEGGASIARWITEAAELEGHWVQSTSVPGVAQRTGATTYYLEVAPAGAGQAPPLMALAPTPGAVDVVLASELVEAGRAMQAGYVAPDRTALITSSHRVYAVAEKGAMGDGRYDAAVVEKAASRMARRAVMFDMAKLASKHSAPVTMTLLGAAAPFLPIKRQTLEAVLSRSLRDGGSLEAFAAGWDAALGTTYDTAGQTRHSLLASAASFALDDYPSEARSILESGVQRLIDYQDAAYARLYLSRIKRIAELDRRLDGHRIGFRLTRETARYAALWMSYEDVIRVADLKTRRERLDQVRKESGAGDNQPIRIIEFLKPGLDEICSLLPSRLARPVQRLARRYSLRSRLNLEMRISSNRLVGFLLFRALALLRRFRRSTSRWQQEQQAIERWLAAVEAAAMQDLEFACAIAECASLIKGYGETHQRGTANFQRILEFCHTGCRAGEDPQELSRRVQAAREAALADPEGHTLLRALQQEKPARCADAEGAMLEERTI